jgi:hypothetical protein
MATTFTEKELELNGVTYLCEIEVEGNLVDESFDHEFGTEYLSSIELVGVEIVTVYDQNDNVVVKRRIISALENMISLEDFEDVEFDFSN